MTNFFNDLPLDVLMNVLHFLDGDDVLHLFQVSSKLYRLLSSSDLDAQWTFRSAVHQRLPALQRISTENLPETFFSRNPKQKQGLSKHFVVMESNCKKRKMVEVDQTETKDATPPSRKSGVENINWARILLKLCLEACHVCSSNPANSGLYYYIPLDPNFIFFPICHECFLHENHCALEVDQCFRLLPNMTIQEATQIQKSSGSDSIKATAVCDVWNNYEIRVLWKQSIIHKLKTKNKEVSLNSPAVGSKSIEGLTQSCA